MAQVPDTESIRIGDGSTVQFTFDFPYLQGEDVFVEVAGVPTAYTYVTSNTVELPFAPDSGAVVRLYRSTPAAAAAYEFQLGAPFLPAFVDENFRQVLYALQEGLQEFGAVDDRSQEALERAEGAEAAAIASAQSAAAAQASISRAVRSPAGESLAPLPNAAARANRLMGFDASGQPTLTPSDTTYVRRSGDSMNGPLQMGSNRLQVRPSMAGDEAVARSELDVEAALRIAESQARQAADANLQAQISEAAPLEASAFSPISWHAQEVANSVTIPENVNAWSFGPEVSIAAGQEVTIGAGSFWTIANGEGQ